MPINKYAKYAYSTIYGLRHRMMLNEEEIVNGITTGIIIPVDKGGFQMYNYNPDEINLLYTDTE